jgi:hypothetical protein
MYLQKRAIGIFSEMHEHVAILEMRARRRLDASAPTDNHFDGSSVVRADTHGLQLQTA